MPNSQGDKAAAELPYHSATEKINFHPSIHHLFVGSCLTFRPVCLPDKDHLSVCAFAPQPISLLRRQHQLYSMFNHSLTESFKKKSLDSIYWAVLKLMCIQTKLSCMYPSSYREPCCLKQCSGHTEAGYVHLVFIFLTEWHPDSQFSCSAQLNGQKEAFNLIRRVCLWALYNDQNQLQG